MASEVVVLKPVNLGRFAHTLYQEDLEQLKMLSNLLNFIRDLYTDKRDYCKAALDGGAVVEPGALDAWVVNQDVAGYIVPPFKIRKVVLKKRAS